LELSLCFYRPYALHSPHPINIGKALTETGKIGQLDKHHTEALLLLLVVLAVAAATAAAVAVYQ